MTQVSSESYFSLLLPSYCSKLFDFNVDSPILKRGCSGDDKESEQSNFSGFHLHKKVWENHHGNRGCLKTKTHPCVIRRLIWEKVSPLIITYVAHDLCVPLCGAVITLCVLPLIMAGSSTYCFDNCLDLLGIGCTWKFGFAGGMWNCALLQFLLWC